jgi:hypothetical protein
VNAIQDTQDYNNVGLDIQVNGTKEFTNITFPQASGSTYVSVPSGNDTVEGFQTGTTTPAFNFPGLTMNSGSQYTLVATGSAAGGGTNVVVMSPSDNSTAPANGSVNFRIINASPSGPQGGGSTPDVYILPNPATLPTSCANAGINCISALAYSNTSSYVTLPINTVGNGWQLIVTVTGNGNPVFSTTINGFGSASEGAICTLVLTDQQNGFQMSSTPVVLQDLNASGCSVN